jgi:uncharacterized membrane protein
MGIALPAYFPKYAPTGRHQFERPDMKNTFLSGLFVLLPLAIIAIVLDKALGYARLIAEPLGGVVPIDRVGGVAVASIIAMILLVAACFLAGAAVQKDLFGGRLQSIDALLVEVVPGYIVFRGLLGGITGTEDPETALRAVMVRFDDYEQIAFEVERNADRVVVYLPGSPAAWSGTTVFVSPDRVTKLNISLPKATAMLRVMGHGSLSNGSIGAIR